MFENYVGISHHLNINLADHYRVSLPVFALANSGRGNILVLVGRGGLGWNLGAQKLLAR